MTLARRSVAEFIGTAFLVATVIGSGIMAERLANGNVALVLLANTIATGAVLVALITVLFGLLASSNVLTSFENYLGALLYFLIPWTAINLTDFYLVRRGHYRTEDFFDANGPFGLFNWRGLLVYVITFGIEIPFMNTAVYQGPISKQLGGADIAWIVGLCVSVPLYYFIARGTVPAADSATTADAGPVA